MRQIDHDRSERWALVSTRLRKVDLYLTILIQSLGKLDSQLVIEDERLLKKMPLDASDPDAIQTSIELGDHITLSYLWVLGAYELVRTLDAYCRENPEVFGEEINQRINETKKYFARVRVPLSKLKPANGHEKTDYQIAYPAMDLQGVAWQINPTTIICRRDLSDRLLDLFEEFPVK